MRKALIITGIITGMLMPLQSVQAQTGFTWFSVKVVSTTDLSNILSENRRGIDLTTTDFEGQTSTVKVNLGEFISNLGINTSTIATFTKQNPPTEFTIPTSGSTVDDTTAGQLVANKVQNGDQNAGDLANTLINQSTQSSTDPNAGQNVAQDIVTQVTNNPGTQNSDIVQQVVSTVNNNSNVDSGTIVSKASPTPTAALL